MRIQATGRDQAHSFDAEADETILDAGLRSRVALPYECGSGTCGTCRAKLTSGSADDRWPDAPGKKLFKPDAGEILMCQSVALGDCTVTVPSRVGTMPDGAFAPARLTGVLRDWTRLTHDVVQFDLDLDRPLSFDAGQFVLMGIPGVEGRRAYSMVSYERPSLRLRFVVKKKPGGLVSEWLFGPEVEATNISLFGPLGAATFTPDVDKHLLCIAGGSGIAGLMSILARATADDHFSAHRGHVFFGVRTPRDLFFLDELTVFKRRAPEALEVTLALSEEAAPDDVRARHPELGFDTGFVHEVAGRHMKARFEGVRAYLAGPPPMVDATLRLLLREARLSPRDIRYDKFS